MIHKLIIVIIIIIILLFIFNTFFKKQQYIVIDNLKGGKKKNGGALNKTFEIFSDKQPFLYGAENIYILDKPNEITNNIIKTLSEFHLNWSYEYSGEAIKYNPMYIITNPDISEEQINKLLNYTFTHQLILINSKITDLQFNSKLFLIQISKNNDIIYGGKNIIYNVTINDLKVFLNTFSFVHLGKSIQPGYFLKPLRNIFLNRIKNVNVVNTIFGFNYGLNDWCQQKNRTLKLSELKFLGQGCNNVCVRIPDFDHILRISIRMSSPLDTNEISEVKLNFIKKYRPSPILKFYDYHIDPPNSVWMEVEECTPIATFENFKDYVNYDVKKLKRFLLQIKKLFDNNYTERKINDKYVDYYSWYDLNIGNIMLNKNGDYVLVDLDFAFGKNWKLISSNLDNRLDKNVTPYDFIGKKIFSLNGDVYTFMYYILKRHKYEYHNNKIIEYFFNKYNYLRFLENKKLDKLISETTSVEKQIELKNKFNAITEKIVDNLIHENFNVLPDDI